ncbi:MAG: AmmeMemoRadiSam system protein A [Nitrospirota bacterium]|nr:AmmeMemoRadiSam system protein A [Nitrospirota bacterium]MDH5769102.1 AmmeMemoRadiSam system protein A [Nitrospirota bacterium]
MHPLAELAKNTIETYIVEGRTIDPPKPIPPEMAQKAGVFVSLKKQGQLRGCIGTYMPQCENIALEIIRNAIAAATQDYRFSPVQKDELEDIVYSVDVLSPAEKVNKIDELNPKKYGVIIVSGYRKGLLLPDIEGVDTIEEQLRIAKLKAGILPQEEVEIFRFEVTRYK